MATLSKDGHGSWHASGVVVRDARHTHNGPSEPAHRATKDKRRWCRGKVGVAHKLVVRLDTSWIRPQLLRYCTVCGKEFGSYWRFEYDVVDRHRRVVEHVVPPPPDWVSEKDLAALREAQPPT